MSNWISLKEQFPSRWQLVLLTIETMNGPRVPSNLFTWTGEKFTVGLTDEPYTPKVAITHWQAIPEPAVEPPYSGSITDSEDVLRGANE